METKIFPKYFIEKKKNYAGPHKEEYEKHMKKNLFYINRPQNYVMQN